MASTWRDHVDEPQSGVTFDEVADVVVVGFGYAGAVAAIEAHDAGASVVLLEKMPNPGGISICSGGGARAAHDSETALRYLTLTCGGRTPEGVLAVLAQGMVEIGDYLKSLATICDAQVSSTVDRPVEWDSSKRGGNYPLPGWETAVGAGGWGGSPCFERRSAARPARGSASTTRAVVASHRAQH